MGKKQTNKKQKKKKTPRFLQLDEYIRLYEKKKEKKSSQARTSATISIMNCTN